MSTIKELKFCDKVLDNVHGFIYLTKVEQRIMELPIFKRLQGIKQLSLVNWIFPGSEHTRYTHSLGVMHIADKMAVQLKYDAKNRQLIRLAGLLHDIGHYPLSHVCESAYKNHSFSIDNEISKQNKISVKKQIDDIEKHTFKVNYMTKSNDKFHHERIGESIIQSDKDIAKIIEEECGNDIKIEDICDIITGNVERSIELSDKVQLMHSELDADGIDYMLRDALFSGTSFGNFEVDQLISCLECKEIDGVRIVGINPKGIPAADQYLINKFFSYMQVIFNKHASVLEYMAETIAFWLRANGTFLPDQKSFESAWVANHKNNELFLRFKDDYFWKTIYDLDNVRGIVPKEMQVFSKNLILHKELKWKEGNEIKIISSDIGEIKQYLTSSEMYRNLSKDNMDITLFQMQSMTKHVPVKEFLNRTSTKKDENGDLYDDELIRTLTIRRLQEGIAVIEGDTARLLCDDCRSMMRQLYRTKCVTLREYQIDD